MTPGPVWGLDGSGRLWAQMDCGWMALDGSGLLWMVLKALDGSGWLWMAPKSIPKTQLFTDVSTRKKGPILNGPNFLLQEVHGWAVVAPVKS